LLWYFPVPEVFNLTHRTATLPLASTVSWPAAATRTQFRTTSGEISLAATGKEGLFRGLQKIRALGDFQLAAGFIQSWPVRRVLPCCGRLPNALAVLLGLAGLPAFLRLGISLAGHREGLVSKIGSQ